MTIAAADFRGQFPIFANSTKYPDSQVTFYINLAYKLLNADRWGTMLDEGAALFTAHFLSVDALSSKAGVAGVPGSAVGVVNSGSVDKVSYGRDVASVMEETAGHWGMSTYGLQYLRFARMMGMGPVHIGAGCDPSGLGFYNGAWPGPYYG